MSIRLGSLAICLMTLLCWSLGRGSVANAATGIATPPTVAGTESWPQLLQNAFHSSKATDPKLKATQAATMGINWMSALRAADLGSPASAFSTALSKTLVYVGDERGDVVAYDEATGFNVWSTSVGFGDSERASPMVAPDGSVWVATSYGSTLYKLDGTTGKVLCSAKEAIRFDASPSFATPPGGVPSVFIATNYQGAISGPTISIRESDCKTQWLFTNYIQITGGWAEPAYGVDVNGRGLVYEGTADPDATLYAIDALKGTLVWSFSVANPPNGSYDIGAGATVSPPGKNGFADGVIYQPAKSGHLYAIDLTTGKQIWDFDFNSFNKVNGGGRSAAALSNNTLALGMSDGVIAVNATTGAQLWHFKDQTGSEVLSSPAIAGPANNQIVTFGDSGGAFHALRLSDGTELYNYQTGGYITSSPAVVNGHVLIDSTDGFLYDFKTFGANVAPPTTAVSVPKQGQQLPNPNGSLTVTGSATDAAGLASVQVSVQAGGPTGSWYDAATNSWVAGAVDNVVAVAQPKKKQSAWTFSFPVPAAGATYQVFANAVDTKGQVDRTGAEPTFSVMPSKTQPTIATTALFVAPATSFSVTGNAFAPGETVTYTLEGTLIGKGTANANGVVPAVVLTVPASDAFGLTDLVAQGQTSGDSTTAPVDISNVWSQLGYGPTKTAYEPNDVVLQQTLQPTAKGYVSRAWLFLTGAAVDASPAIGAGNAYVGNDAGQMYAVDTISGAPLWQYTTPSGAAIHGSPALDINAGLLVFGSDDGDLYTLSATTGALVGTTELNGIPTAPALAGGRLYTGTDAGTLFAINETTGALVWSTPLAAAIHSAPAVDTVASLVIAGDDSGAVTALNATTGAKVWSVKTGASVTASPAISGGYVYIASTDGKMYVVKETTGAAKFNFQAHSPIRTGVAIAGASIQLGTASGVLYELNLSGNIVFENPIFANPIVGLGSVAGVPWVETSSGLVGAAKTDQEGREVYNYQTGAGLSTQPAIVNGAVYVGAEDGGLYAFTPYGFAPQSSIIHNAFMMRGRTHPPAKWTHASSFVKAAVATRSFAPFGPRDFALHVDRGLSESVSTSIVSHGGPIQTKPHSYLIYWAPAGTGRVGDVAAASAALGQGAIVSGIVQDSAPYPRSFDDAAVQREIARQIAINRWPVNVGSQMFVVTGGAATASARRYCGYHSAFNLAANLAAPVPYAFVPSIDAASGCGTLSRVLTREQTELRTDPLLNGWHDALGVELSH